MPRGRGGRAKLWAFGVADLAAGKLDPSDLHALLDIRTRVRMIERMQSTKAAHLLFIEPVGPCAAEPLIDDVTRKLAGAWRQRAVSEFGYRGVHAAHCGARSDIFDHYLLIDEGGPRAIVTNSLALHYVAYHRSEVPPFELDKIERLIAEPVDPTAAELLGTDETPPTTIPVLSRLNRPAPPRAA